MAKSSHQGMNNASDSQNGLHHEGNKDIYNFHIYSFVEKYVGRRYSLQICCSVDSRDRS
jgi:hypothetical protein